MLNLFTTMFKMIFELLKYPLYIILICIILFFIHIDNIVAIIGTKIDVVPASFVPIFIDKSIFKISNFTFFIAPIIFLLNILLLLNTLDSKFLNCLLILSLFFNLSILSFVILIFNIGNL